MTKLIRNYTMFIVYIVILYFIMKLPNFIFRDRDSYVYYASYYNSIIESYYSEGIQNLLLNEPLFLFINSWLAKLFSPYIIPVLFTAFSFSVFFWFLSKRSKNLIMFFLGLCLYFTVTYTFHLQFVVLRQSLSTFILLIVLFYCKDYRKILFTCFLLGFIHSSFFFIFILLCINRLILKNTKSEYVAIILQILIFAAIGIFALSAASYLGFRQAESLIDTSVSIGGGAWLLWLVATLYLIFYGDKSKEGLYQYCLVGMLAFLSLYFFTPFIGRLIASFIPAFIIILVSRFRYSDLITALLLLIPYMYLVYNGVLFDLSFTMIADDFYRVKIF